MSLKSLSVFVCLFIFSSNLYAQEKSKVKFGHVSPEDFDISKLTTDTSDGAVIIADIGYSMVEENLHSFNLEFNRKTRIKIINKNGFDLANVTIPLYKNDRTKETVDNIKGVTYNIENGKVVVTKLGKDAIFEDNYDKNHIAQKFTLPEVKEGSIIEFSYTINSGFLFNLQPWEFQGKYPCLWSEYETNIPDYFRYVTIMQGYKSFDINTESEGTSIFNSTQSVLTSDKRWVMKNVPALKEEKFTSTIDNYIAKIEFQMAGINFPQEPYRDVLSTWPKVSEELLKSDEFGERLNKNNGWLKDSIRKVIAGTVSDLDKAYKIYNYVRDNIKSNHYRGIFLGKDVKEVFKNRNGSIAEVNMLLITMLRHENINADPVILSTVDHGFTNPIYPMVDKFNYVVCKVSIDTSVFFLDASESYLGFGRLPIYCYNGYARIINEIPSAVSLSPDSLLQPKSTTITLLNDSSKSGSWTGTVNSIMNFAESNKIRNRIAIKGKDDFEKELINSYSEDASISKIEIDSLNNYETPLEINHDIKIEGSITGDVIYFNPLLINDYKENPLKASERIYPVEMPYPVNESYKLQIEIPTGYEIDELPKSAKVIFNDTEGLFEYYVYKGETELLLKIHLQLAKASFLPGDYQDLRSFYDYIVKKASEQFIFKKKK